MNGNLDIAAGTLLAFSNLAAASAQAFVEDTTVFAMINYTGTWNNGLFTYNGQPLADGSRFSVGSQLWEIDYDYQYTGSNIQPLNFTGSQDTNGSYVTVTAVPEPATLALLAAAASLALLRRARCPSPLRGGRRGVGPFLGFRQPGQPFTTNPPPGTIRR